MRKLKARLRDTKSVNENPSPIFFERMEPRVLLSADALSGLTPADPFADNDATRNSMNAGESASYLLDAYAVNKTGSQDDQAESIDQVGLLDALRTSSDNTEFADHPADTLDTLAAMLDSAEIEDRREIVFVDAATPDYEQLIGAFDSDTPGTDYQVFILQSDRDGIEQITEILAGLDAVDAIHLVSHGNEGGLQLGNAWLGTSTMDAHTESLRSWSGALADEADILIYGCNLAANEQGRALVDAIGAMTGADVAASTDLTGHAASGGDWDLEYQVGVLESRQGIFEYAATQWGHVLALHAYEGFDYGAGVLDNQNGGSGWATAWSDEGGRADTSLAGLNSPTGTLLTSGGGVDLATTGFEELTQSRTLSQSYGADGTTVWLSFLLKPGDTGSIFDYMALQLGETSSPQLWVGYSGSDFYLSNDDSSDAYSVAGISPNSGQTYFLAVEMTFTSGNDSFTLYVNPTPGETNPDSIYSVTKTDLDLGTFSHIDLVGGTGSNAAALDEIRIGDTYADVAIDNSSTVSLDAIQDSYIDISNSGVNYGSAGTLNVDRSGGNEGDQQALLEFDVSSISPGSTISSAYLVMEATATTGAFSVNAYEITQAWNENTVTWDTAPTYNNTSITTLTPGGIGEHSFEITSLVQSWVDNPANNHGVLLGSEEAGTTTFSYDSREGPNFPQLVITYANVAPVALDDSYSTNEDVNLVVGAGSDLLDNDSDANGDTLTAEVTDGPDNGMLVFDPIGLGTETNLTNDGAFDHHARWSPDGSKVAFTSERGAGGDRDIYIMNADGTGVTALTTDGTFTDEQPVWSPDGSMLAIASNRDGDNEIFIIDATNGSMIRQLTSDAGADQRPTWSPDGSQIAWTSDRDGNFDIWVANADGSGVPSKLTTAGGDDTQPVWSPDGSKILFVSTRDGNENIYVMDADGSNETRLTSDAGADRIGSWSPDGSKIFFTSDRSGNYDIWVMDADGSNKHVVEATAADEYWTEVSADGTTLLTMRGFEIYKMPLQFDGTFTYVPDAGFSGTENFSYVANDGVENSNVATATITIDGKPDFVASGPFSVDEAATAGTVVGDVDANDGDGGAADAGISYSITGNIDPDGDSRKTFIIDSATGVITVNDADDLNFEDNASLNITVEADDGINTESTTVTINLNNINEAPSVITPTPVFINEIHYDNVGLDSGEAIEIAGVAGNDLNDWTLVMYNGFDGSVYDTVALSGVLPNQSDNFGTLAFSFPADGIQNATSGNPDGVALVDPSGNVVQFLSYEGSFTATDGPASGMASTDIGVAEDNATTAVGESLQLTGAGATFTWAAAGAETFGTPNTGQDFAALAAASQQMVDEEADLVFSTANGNAILVGDVDAALSAAADPVSVSLSVSNGTLTLGGTTGLGSIVGNGSGNVTFTGTVAELNAAMEGLTYKAVTDFNGTDTLTVLVDDQGNDGLGGAQTATGTVHITVNPVDDPLNVNTTGNTVTFTEDAGATTALFSAGIDTIETGDTISQLVLTLANVEAGDTLLFGATSVDLNSNGTTGPDAAGFSYTVSSAGASPVVTISHGGADDGTVNTMLNSLLFDNTSNNDPSTTARTVTLTSLTDSGSGLTLDGTVATVNVTPTNDAPTATNLSSTSSYNEGDASVAITDIVVSDADSAEVVTATLTLADTATGSLSANDGASYDGFTGIWTITGSVAQVNTALANLVFNPAPTNDVDTSIAVSIDDGDEDGSGALTGSITLDVTPFNTAPAATNLSSTSTYDEGDATVPITDIVVSDADAGDIVTATLTLADTSTGSLSANDGATYDPLSGIWAIADTVANVNTALANLVFNPDSNNDIDTSIAVSIDDGDEDGSGALTGAITLDVTPVNDAPTATNLASSSDYNQGDSSLALNDIVITDIDSGETVTATLTLLNTASGSLSANDGATYDAGSGIWTITGSVAQVNTALANLEFIPLPGNTLDTAIAISIDDGDEDNSGPLLGAISITVNPLPVTEPPIVEPPPEEPFEPPVESEEPESAAEETAGEITASEPPPTADVEPIMVAQTRAPGPILPATSGVDFEDPVQRNDDRENDRETVDPKPTGVENLLVRLREQIDFYNDPLQVIGAETFITRLNDMREELISETANTEKVVGSSLTVTAGLSVGYVVWLARSGVLLSSALSSLPAWRFIDPLPVLAGLQNSSADDDEESLESMVADKSAETGDHESAGEDKSDG